MMSCENQSTAIRSMSSSPSSLPTTPSFVRKFHSNFRPLDLRKLTLYGSSIQSSSSIPVPIPSAITHQTSDDSPSGSGYSSTPSCSSSQDSSPKIRHFGSCHSHDSFILKRQSSQTRLRESLLSSLLLSPRTKEIEFTVPQTLSPLTPTFGRKGLTSGESSPGSMSGSRSETDPSNSRANTPSPIFFRGSGPDISGLSVQGKKITTPVGVPQYPFPHPLFASCTPSQTALPRYFKGRQKLQKRTSLSTIQGKPSKRIAAEGAFQRIPNSTGGI